MLLYAFFPAPYDLSPGWARAPAKTNQYPKQKCTGAGPRALPVRVSDQENPLGNGVRVAVLITVHFGPNSQNLDIVDGPTALGYIFSVATPPPANPT